jgi:hypothetical protein
MAGCLPSRECSHAFAYVGSFENWSHFSSCYLRLRGKCDSGWSSKAAAAECFIRQRNSRRTAEASATERDSCRPSQATAAQQSACQRNSCRPSQAAAAQRDSCWPAQASTAQRDSSWSSEAPASYSLSGRPKLKISNDPTHEWDRCVLGGCSWSESPNYSTHLAGRLEISRGHA